MYFVGMENYSPYICQVYQGGNLRTAALILLLTGAVGVKSLRTDVEVDGELGLLYTPFTTNRLATSGSKQSSTASAQVQTVFQVLLGAEASTTWGNGAAGRSHVNASEGGW